MDAEKWQSRIWHRVDEMPHQLARGWLELEVFPTERHNFALRFFAGELKDAIRIQPGAIDNKVCFNFPLGSQYNLLAALSEQTGDADARTNLISLLT